MEFWALTDAVAEFANNDKPPLAVEIEAAPDVVDEITTPVEPYIDA